MTRSVLTLAVAAAVLVAAACGPRKTPTRGERAADEPVATGDGTAPSPPVKRVLLAWSLEPTTAKTKVNLSATDEMGRVVNHPVGEFDGTCTDVGPIELYRATIAVTCGQAGRGVQLHAVAGRGEVVVMAMDVAEGTEPDPMARRQIARIDTPLDAAVSAGR